MRFPPSTYVTCSGCGERVTPVVVTVSRRGDFNACARCHGDYLRQCAANQVDEDRERAASAQRTAEAARRDAQRIERQRAKEAQT